MANEWIPNFVFNTLESGGVKITLAEKSVTVRTEWQGSDNWIELFPLTQKEAHNLALMFRKAARRFEEMGKGLPNG